MDIIYVVSQLWWDNNKTQTERYAIQLAYYAVSRTQRQWRRQDVKAAISFPGQDSGRNRQIIGCNAANARSAEKCGRKAQRMRA